MDNPSGGGIPTQPPSSQMNRPDVASDEPEFTVPVPTSAPTQALPAMPPPPPPPGPWTGAPAAPPHAPASVGMPPTPYAAAPLAPQGPSDADSLRNLGLVLLGVVIGFWLFVLIRLAAYAMEVGTTDRMLIETIDMVSVETVAAALVSILAVASIIGSQLMDRRRRSGPLLWSAILLAVVTLATTVWRLV